MEKKKFDVVVIGGGAGGFVSAKFVRGIGKSVAIVEKERLGGECTWTGCVPSKALINVANMFGKIKKLAQIGLIKQSVGFADDKNVMNHVRMVRERVYKSHPPESFEALGITVFFGSPKFIDPHTIEFGETRLSAKKFIIATGSSPFVPPTTGGFNPLPGLDAIDYLTNRNFFELETLPDSLLIMGGGPIGVELASALTKLGVEVTIVEMQDCVLAREDRELAELLQEKLRNDGVTVMTETKVMKVENDGDGVVATCQDRQGETLHVRARKLLVATGRKPNVEGLSLENADVDYDRRGIKTLPTMQTSAKHIYACGDVVGPYQFSHMAEHQAIVAARNALFPFAKKISYEHRIWVTYSDPEFASAGINEDEARKVYGDKVEIYAIEYKTVDRAVTDVVVDGLAKFVCDKKGNLLGAQILGPRAGEIIHEVQLGKTHGINFAKFDHVIHAYPTYCDVVKKAARLCRIDLIKNNFFVKALRWVTGK